jgi:hypothetical protein
MLDPYEVFGETGLLNKPRSKRKRKREYKEALRQSLLIGNDVNNQPSADLDPIIHLPSSGLEPDQEPLPSPTSTSDQPPPLPRRLLEEIEEISGDIFHLEDEDHHEAIEDVLEEEEVPVPPSVEEGDGAANNQDFISKLPRLYQVRQSSRVRILIFDRPSCLNTLCV